MKIAKNCIVTLNYIVSSVDGELIDDGGEQIVYLHGGYDDIFKKIEVELEGKSEGYKCAISMEPSDAFGDYDEDLVVVEPRSSFADDLRVGMQVEGEMEGETRIFTVTEMTEDRVVVDGNHPLAGLPLVFSCEVAGVREATAEEIAQKQ